MAAQFAEDIKEYEFSFCGFSFGDDGKYYPWEFLEAVCDNGGFVEETKPLEKEYHIVYAPYNGCFGFPGDNAGILKLAACNIKKSYVQTREILRNIN